jgi:RNA polymerase I-specific transcription initiation factor RRN7
LISLIVVATKLSHPFDDITRIPESDVDPTTVKIDWKIWNEIMADAPLTGLKRGDEMTITDETVMGMDGKKIDDYLDWYQRIWIDDRDSKSECAFSSRCRVMLTAVVPEQILELFPLSDLSPLPPENPCSDKCVERLKRVQHNMVLQKPKPVDGASQDVRRPGDLYRRYRSIKEVPENAKAFYELAGMFGRYPCLLLRINTLTAENTAISTRMLVQGVYKTEGHLMEWNLEDRRQLLAEEEDMIFDE